MVFLRKNFILPITNTLFPLKQNMLSHSAYCIHEEKSKTNGTANLALITEVPPRYLVLD